jgi:hypothetical protein
MDAVIGHRDIRDPSDLFTLQSGETLICTPSIRT